MRQCRDEEAKRPAWPCEQAALGHREPVLSPHPPRPRASPCSPLSPQPVSLCTIPWHGPVVCQGLGHVTLHASSSAMSCGGTWSDCPGPVPLDFSTPTRRGGPVVREEQVVSCPLVLRHHCREHKSRKVKGKDSSQRLS